MNSIVERCIDGFPMRPMSNQERRAAWAVKYYQIKPAMPNNFKWKFNRGNRPITGE